MSDHLLLPERRLLDSRRQGASGGPGSLPRNPRRHGENLHSQLTAALRPIRVVEGVDPARVFKVTARSRVTDQTWSAKDLQFLGETADWRYFVLSLGDEPSRLLEQLDTYSQGPDRMGAHGTNYTFFDGVETIEAYGPDDRRGPGLPEDPDQLAEPIIVDIIAWPSPDGDEAARRLADIRHVVSHHGGLEIAFDARPRYTVLRARISGPGLRDLLELAVVERVRPPPVPYLEPSEWLTASLEDLGNIDTAPGEPIGIIDDAITDHPLLVDAVATRRAFPADHNWQPPGQHGTMVAGIALFGEFEQTLRAGQPFERQGLVHQARVLEPDPERLQATRFAPSITSHQAIEQAIEILHSEEGVRVFNLSVNDRDAYAGPHVGLLSERLDELIRELDIIVVVSTGNVAVSPHTGLMASGHHVEHGYPFYLTHPSARIAEPATAALALTVGGLARFEAAQTLRGDARVGDQAIAGAGQIAPFTRTGPGAFKGVKPELIDYAGNWALTDTNTVDTQNPGVGVISLAMNPSGRLFAVSSGTSFAAPRVARLAARVWATYPDASANLVRALMAVSARVPGAVRVQFPDSSELLPIAGYGQPDGARALVSDGPRVVMMFDGEMPSDTAAIHPIPIPAAFSRGRASRRLSVALAYDPPVRRQRREYLGGDMIFDVLRNVSIDDVAERYARQGAQRVPLYQNRTKLDLSPGPQATNNSTLICRSIDVQLLDPDDGDAYYLAVSHRSAPWADAGDQRYALAVELVENERVEIDLYAAVQTEVRTRARIRLRS